MKYMIVLFSNFYWLFSRSNSSHEIFVEFWRKHKFIHIYAKRFLYSSCQRYNREFFFFFCGKIKIFQINFAQNKLSGNLPVCPTPTKLQQFVFSNNNFTGKIPSYLYGVTLVTNVKYDPAPIIWNRNYDGVMDLSNNNLSGGILDSTWTLKANRVIFWRFFRILVRDKLYS